ncbi:hypothetical protein LUX12_02085 [Streptomyces somaliensis]|uniref:hypothetical protein n=1 Tax=Streptomyces somaliensis TaxID=78355 RepID=UPI0020CC0A2C|nr:hypothetical protein [Streptomyces somaliensis]MCP9943859.1 hypothetical protein [Streptomyces somaliensis]MCP9962894.1 hypothetical protein [Streptomyces somaliensis]MCP9975742.1 hypothetical protein [Streptomyces somaliensis]
MDVTIRDGGYVNGHSWTVAQATRLVTACRAAGVPYIEIGYLRPGRHAVDGDEAPSASCPPAYLERVAEAAAGIDTVVMAHAKDTVPEDLARLADFGVSMVRMPTRPDRLKRLAPYVDAAHNAGLSFAVNLIRVSEVPDHDVVTAARTAEEITADIFYLADSNGSLFPEDVGRLCGMVRESTGATLGFHPHDGISMSFANTLTAMRLGARYVDASLSGMGKGGGNLSLQLITGYLRSRACQAFCVTPLVDAAADLLVPWKGDQILAQCESIASGLLDLNLEDLAEIRAMNPKKVFSILDGTSAVR